MANLLLTEVCVRKCPYCFAKQYMEGTEDKSAITMENLTYVVDFLENSKLKNISLLGGEPLIHPRISEILEYLLVDREFEVCIFTSGIMPPKKIEPFIEKVKSIMQVCKTKLTFVVNVNEPRFSSKAELDKVHTFLSGLHEYCALSFNIYRLDYDLDFLIEYILKFGLRRHVRFGIANPIPGADNQYIDPKDFPKAKVTLMSALARMNELNIFPGLDCGFPMCMFSDEDLGRLYKYTANGLQFECGPTIDIGPDLQCWSCFPLSAINRVNLKDFKNIDELYSSFNKLQQTYRNEINGIYDDCSTCKNYENGICSGGCLAHILNRYHKEGNFRLK